MGKIGIDRVAGFDNIEIQMAFGLGLTTRLAMAMRKAVKETSL